MRKKYLLSCVLISVQFFVVSCGNTNKASFTTENIDSTETESVDSVKLVQNVPNSQEMPLCPKTSMFMLDKSVSMRGYFESSDSRIRGIISQYINLSTNNSIHFFDTKKSDAIEKVKFSDMLRNGSKLDAQESNLKDMLQEMVDQSGNMDVSMLLTDGILSGSNAQINDDREYNIKHRDWMKNEIKKIFSDSKDICALVIKYGAKFKGKYSCYNNASKDLNDIERPYYIIAVGKWKYIKYMEQELTNTNSNVLDNNYQDYVMFGDLVSYEKIKFSYKSGISNIDSQTGAMVLKGPARAGKEDVVLSASLKSLPIYMRTQEYWKNNLDVKVKHQNVSETDMTVGEDYEIKIEEKNGEAVQVLLTMPGMKIKNSDLILKLRYCQPEWIFKTTDDKDLDIKDNVIKHNKTFNLECLVSGIAGVQNKEYIKELTIKIK